MTKNDTVNVAVVREIFSNLADIAGDLGRGSSNDLQALFDVAIRLADKGCKYVTQSHSNITFTDGGYLYTFDYNYNSHMEIMTGVSSDFLPTTEEINVYGGGVSLYRQEKLEQYNPNNTIHKVQFEALQRLWSVWEYDLDEWESNWYATDAPHKIIGHEILNAFRAMCNCYGDDRFVFITTEITPARVGFTATGQMKLYQLIQFDSLG